MLIRLLGQDGLQRPPKALASAHSQVYRSDRRSGVRSGRGSSLGLQSQEKGGMP